MAIENFDEVKNYFEANKDSEDVKSFLGGFSNLDVFKEKINTDPTFKSFLDSEKDKHYTKALDTWKTNNLEKLVDEKVNQLYPKADPKDTELAKLKQQLDQIQKDATRKDLTNKAYKIATEKKLPTDLVDYFIGNDEDSTLQNIDKLSQILSAHDEALKKELVAGNSYTPPADKGGNLSGADKLKEEIRKSMGMK